MFFGSIFNLCLLAVINIRIIAAPKSDQPPTGGLDPSFIRGKAPKANEPIIIVGGGLAGLSAAVEALEEGAKVILLDKEKSLGGNSAKASSGINGCGTKAQKAHGIMDTTKLFYDDTMKSGDRENDPILVDLLVDESSSAVQFLTERGADLTAINLCGGHSVPRTHWLPPVKEGRPTPVGIAIIRSLNSTLNKWKEENPDQLEIKLEAKVLGLVTWNDFVTGVRYLSVENKIEEITGKGVILTTGGFSSDFTTDSNSTSLLTEFAPNLVNLPTTNGDFASGDGVKMARAMGAELIGMDRVQVHPTAFIDPKNPGAKTKFLAAEALRGKGAILVNERGRRFGNELGRRDYLTDKINKSCKKVMDVGNLPVSFMLMNKESVDDFGRSAFTFYAKIKGFFMELNGAEQVAKEIGCSVEELTQTLKEHNEFYEQSKADSGFKDSFGKTVFPVKFDPKETIYLARITPALHYTMGGLKIDKHAVVFSEFINKPFQGLLAAGEVTGGVHGRNRLAGNSLLECVVFGRIAGKSAAKINYQRLDGLETTTVNESEHPEL